MGTASPELAPEHSVLVAVDFSPEADAALDLAAELADGMKRPLLVLHVVHDPAHAPGSYVGRDTADDEQRKKDDKHWKKRARTLHDAAEEMLRDYLEARRDASPARKSLRNAHVALVTGTPASRIVEVAHAHSASLIVMGTRGRSALSGILLGSNAHRVVQLSRVPVTLVKTADGAKPPKRAKRK
ncbi:MAG: universal stress protein [Deltaproteobacteria bacterium]|nr:MAG: universal stress protein [Deltaproteobacteria bacterium]